MKHDEKNEPEDEYEEDEQSAEGSDTVHSSEHDGQLIPQSRHEPHQLEYTQQPERPQH